MASLADNQCYPNTDKYKRGIGGVSHSVSEQYLQTYLDEYTFRYLGAI